MIRYGRRILPLLMLTIALSACSTAGMRKVQGDIADRATEAQSHLESQQHSGNEPYYREVDEIFIGSNTVPVRKADARPDALDQPVMYKKQYPVTLSMLAEYISTTHGVRVSVTQDALAAASDSAYDPVQAMQQRSAGGTTATTAPAPAAASAGNVNPSAGAFLIQYEGPLAGLLDQACARTGTAWRYENDQILIFGLDTRTFAIHSVPGATSINATISNQSQAGTSGGGGQSSGGGSGGAASSASTQSTSGQNTHVAAEVAVFPSVVDAVKSMLSTKGRVAVNQATSSITVTDAPAALNRIQTYIDGENEKLTRQVMIDVRVYSVELNQGENYGVDWNLIWKSVNGQIGGDLSSSPDIVQGASKFALSVLDPTSAYAGSKILLNALSQQGDVSTKTSATVVTTSNSPVPVQVTEETSYLAQVQTTLVANAGAQTTLTPGTVTTGFSMTLIPVVLEESEVLLQMQINLSTLRDIRQITSGNLTIESPQVDSQQFLQRVKLKSGHTLVLSGFEQEALKSDMRGIGSPKFSLAGGSRTTDKRRSVLIVMLTPHVQD